MSSRQASGYRSTGCSASGANTVASMRRMSADSLETIVPCSLSHSTGTLTRALVVGVGGGVGLAEEREAVDGVGVLAAAEAPAPFVAQGIDVGDADGRPRAPSAPGR